MKLNRLPSVAMGTFIRWEGAGSELSAAKQERERIHQLQKTGSPQNHLNIEIKEKKAQLAIWLHNLKSFLTHKAESCVDPAIFGTGL